MGRLRRVSCLRLCFATLRSPGAQKFQCEHYWKHLRRSRLGNWRHLNSARGSKSPSTASSRRDCPSRSRHGPQYRWRAPWGREGRQKKPPQTRFVRTRSCRPSGPSLMQGRWANRRPARWPRTSRPLWHCLPEASAAALRCQAGLRAPGCHCPGIGAHMSLASRRGKSARTGRKPSAPRDLDLQLRPPNALLGLRNCPRDDWGALRAPLPGEQSCSVAQPCLAKRAWKTVGLPPRPYLVPTRRSSQPSQIALPSGRLDRVSW